MNYMRRSSKIRLYLELLLCFVPMIYSFSNTTYENPILPGFYPDPSCTFVPSWNETFFCITSSFLAFPGLPVHSSQNLLDWKLASNVLNWQEQLPSLADVRQQTGGLWAPTIRFHDERFYVLTTPVSEMGTNIISTRWENVIFTSNDPYDPKSWTKAMHFDFNGYDPDIFWDDDGTTYITGARPYTGRQGIDQVAIDLDTRQTGPQITIWSGTGGETPEGPRIYKKDGFYYLVIEEGGTFLGHMVTIARSNCIKGPYQSYFNNPILTNTNTTEYFQAVGHADLFQDARGKWWGVAHGIRLSLEPRALPIGRETSLFPVTWNDGSWPILEPVSGAMSGWESPSRVDRQEMEISGYDEINFNPGSSMPPHLVHWRFPDAESFKISPAEELNSLRLKPSKMNLTATDGLLAPGGQTFIARRQTHTLFTFSAEFTFSPRQIEEEAGVTVFVDQNTHIDFGIVLLDPPRYVHNSSTPPEKHFRLRAQSPRGTLSILEPVPSSWKDEDITLEIKAANMTHYTFSASPTSHRSQGMTVGIAGADLVTPIFTGVLLGVYATRNGADIDPTYAYVRRWRYRGEAQYRD